MTGRRVVSAVGLVALAAGTGLLVVMALVHGAPRQAVPEAAPPTVSASSSADTPAPKKSDTASPSPSASPSASRSPSASPSKESTKGGLATVRETWKSDDEVDVVVLGDESGAGADGWVQNMAEEAAKDRPVTYLEWQNAEADYRRSELGGESGGPINLYNVSLSDGTAASIDDAEQAYGELDPDIVVLNFGHHEVNARIAASFDDLVAALPGDPLVVALMQNPHATQDGQHETVRLVKEWGSDSQTPVLNVFVAFNEDERSLSELLDEQGFLPSAEGADLWASHVLGELDQTE